MRFPNCRSRNIAITVTVVVLTVAIWLGVDRISEALTRAKLSDSLNNISSIKFALDGFATDFDGQYPNAKTAELLSPGFPTRTSNDYFRQLFLAGETQSESIFWLKNSPVAGKKPDDRIMAKKLRKLELNMILEPGDVHWAYVREQTNSSPRDRLLLLDPFAPGTDAFDPDLWGLKVIVLQIDGSVGVLRLDPSDNMPFDGIGQGPPSGKGGDWSDYPGDSMEFLKLDLLVQPAP